MQTHTRTNVSNATQIFQRHYQCFTGATLHLRHLVRGVNALLRHRDDGLGQRRDLGGHAQRLLHRLVRRRDLGDQAEAAGLRGVDGLSRQDHVHRLGLAHSADQPLCAAAAFKSKAAHNDRALYGQTHAA